MGTLLLNQIKKQASSFLQEKYKTARMALTDVTRAELLAEEATNNDTWGPDAKTMTLIAEASFDVDDYWRIVDVLHKRFDNIDWKQWRQSYKSLVLLEFLLTHGPEEFAEEFQCDSDVIGELGTFQHIDEKGFNWGAAMQKRSDHILELLQGGDILKEARFNALRITKEIQGFGNYLACPSSSSSSSPSSSTSDSSRASSFSSYLTASSIFNDTSDINRLEQPSIAKEELEKFSQGGIQQVKIKTSPTSNEECEGSHLWDFPPIQERGSLLEFEDDEEEKREGFISEICSKLAGISPSNECHGEKMSFRSFSDVGRLIKKKYDRQFSLGY